MAQEKTLGFSISINGISNENVEMQKLNIQLSNLNKEYKDLQTTIKQQGGLASNQQLQQLAAYSKEINNHKDSVKELNRVMDSAPDSLKRMRAELDRAKEAAASCSTVIRERMSPYINQMSADVKKAEAAMGTHTRGVGDYTNAIKSAVSQIFAIAAPAAAAAYALNGLKEAFAGTEAGANLLGRAKLQMTAFFDAIVEGKWRYAFGNELPKDIKVIADLMNKIRIDERIEVVAISEKELEIKNLRLAGIKAGKDSVEQVRLLTKAEQVQDELIQVKLNHKGEELNYVNLILAKDAENTTYLNRQAQLQADINNILGERSLRIASKLEVATEKQEIELTFEKAGAIRAVILAEQEQMRQENRQKIADTTMSGPHFGLTGVLAVKIKKETQESVDGIGNIIDKAESNQLRKAQAFENAQLKIIEEGARAKLNIMSGASNLVTALNTKNKTIQKGELIAERGIAIAEVIIQTQTANAIIRAKAAASTLPGPGYFLRLLANEALATPATVMNNVAAGLNIAAIIAATVSGLAGFARGGKINRGMPINTGTVDDTLIAVNKTETVLTQRHVAALGGSGAMQRIGVPGYASGGYVGQQATAMPPSEIDYDKLAEANRRYLNVVLDINKLNQAQNELAIITTTNRI